MKPIQTVPLEFLLSEPYILVERSKTLLEDHCAGRIGKNLRKELDGYAFTIGVDSILLDSGKYRNTYRYYAKLAPVGVGKNL